MLCILLVFALAACDAANTPTETSNPDTSQQSEAPPASGGEESSTPQESSSPTESTPTENQQDLYEIWQGLMGYWNAAEGWYIGFDMQDSHSAVFHDGLWSSGYAREGRVTELTASGEKELTATVYYDAVEATEMDDARPAETNAVIVDYSGDEIDGKIRVKIGTNDWKQYRFGGTRADEARESYLADQQGDLTVTGDTEEEKIASLWKLLEGCWGVDDRFVLFTYNADGKPVFQSGTWEWHFPSNTRDPAVVTSLSNFNGTTFTLGVSYLANEETAADEQDLREYRYTIMVGIEDLAEGIVTVEAPEDEIRTYAFLARTYEEAYETANQGTW